MHVLLCYANPPALTFGFMPAPYGLEILRAHLSELPVECDIVNPYLSLNPRRCLADAVRADTVLIGISLRNLDDALVRWSSAAVEEIQTRSCVAEARSLVAWCRDCAPGVPVVLGGAAFAHMPETLLEYLGADAGFSGMPEQDFVALIAALTVHGHAFETALHGLERAVLPGGRVRLTASAAPSRTGFRRVPVVEREALYFRFRREAAVRTFTGCPLRCSHCIEHLAGRRLERSEVSLVADEVEAVVSRYSEVERIFLADSEVNLAGERRTEELIHAIRGRLGGRRVALAGYFNPRPMSFALLTTLSSAGCDVRLTVDHLADEVLARNGKNFQRRHIQELVEYHRVLGLTLSFCLLLGQPGESERTLEEVFRFVEAIPDEIRGPIYFSPGVRVYSGTPLARQLQDGRLDPKRVIGFDGAGSSLVDPAVYSEPWPPRVLFDYVRERMGGLLTPMNGYLAALSPSDAESLDQEFRAYHVGMASLATDQQESFTALCRVRRNPPFLSSRDQTEFLWTRGRLALQLEQPGQALADWTHIRAKWAGQHVAGAGVNKLDHNIAIAQQILDSS